MAHALIAQLLRLQEEDAGCDHIKDQLESIPREILKVEQRISEAVTRREASLQRLREMEVERKGYEIQVGSAEDRLNKYKQQQLAVKKNEEYRALTAEIDTTQDEISRLEDIELDLMMRIDEKRSEDKALEAEVQAEVANLRAIIARLQENQAAFLAQLESAEAAVREASQGVPESILSTYTYVKGRTRMPPYVVPLRDRKWTGCFLRVSADVESDARDDQRLTRCPSCGRIVFHE